jgi:hypothetical protein
MKFICETFSWMRVTFRDESSELGSTIIGYSDATVTVPNHPLLTRSRASVATVLLQYHICGVGFVIIHHLIPRLVVKGSKSFPGKFYNLHPNTAILPHSPNSKRFSISLPIVRNRDFDERNAL